MYTKCVLFNVEILDLVHALEYIYFYVHLKYEFQLFFSSINHTYVFSIITFTL